MRHLSNKAFYFFFIFAMALFCAFGAFAQAPVQIPLTGNIGVPGGVSVLGGLTVNLPTDSNLTLTPDQWANKTLIITSSVSLSATRNIVAPLNKGQEYNIENKTTGGQSIQVIGASGTGVTIANGSTATVFSDATNYVQGGGASPVASVFSRTGAITAQANDYSFSQLSGAATNAQLPTALTPTTIKIGASSIITAMSGTGTKAASTSGTFVNGDVIIANAVGDMIDSGGLFSNIPTLSGSQVWQGSQTFRSATGVRQLQPATVGNNVVSPPFTISASYCVSSGVCSSDNDVWTVQSIPAAGFNPNIVLRFSSTAGSAGTHTVDIPAGSTVGGVQIATGSSSLLYPGTNGPVCNTSTTAATTCTGSQLATVIGTTAVTNSTNATNAVVANVVGANPFQGNVIPLFKTITGFDNLGATPGNPFAVAAGGGLIAVTSGTTASGYRHMNKTCDTSGLCRIDWLLSWDPTDTTGVVTLGVGPSTNKYQITLSNSASGTFQAVMNNSAGTTNTFSGAVGSGAINITVSFVIGNGGVTGSVCPVGAQLPLTAPNAWLTCQWTYQHINAPRLSNSYFASSSTTSVIKGWLYNSNSLDGDLTGQLLTRTVAQNIGGTPNCVSGNCTTTNVMDHDNVMFIPERTNPSVPVKSILWFHGRTSNVLGDIYGGLFPGAPAEANFATAAQALQAGYVIIGDQGGSGVSNQYSDYWGNQRGTDNFKQTADKYKSVIYNIGKVYVLGQSMGGVDSLNFIRTYPGYVTAAYEATPAIDLNETTCPRGINCAGTLQSSATLAYKYLFINLGASNIGNSPILDNGTNWTQLAGAGEWPTIGMRSWNVFNTTAVITNSPLLVLPYAIPIAAGDFLYFRQSNQTRRVIARTAVGAAGLWLDSPITAPSGEQVEIIHRQPNGKPDPTSFDQFWLNSIGGGGIADYNPATTYSNVGLNLVYQNSPNIDADKAGNNPTLAPETFVGVAQIGIGIGGDGTCTGNDGILNNQQMCDFTTNVNAVYSGRVQNFFFTGINGSGHVAQAMVPATILAFFAAY